MEGTGEKYLIVAKEGDERYLIITDTKFEA